jgi:hypothetical protein
VAVVPGETVSAHFNVAPEKEHSSVTSVSVSFVALENGMVMHSYAGCSQQALVEPKKGQGFTGDTGVDTAVFKSYPHAEKELAVVVAGTVLEDEVSRNYFFKKTFQLD